jgi:hypothetical protein
MQGSEAWLRCSFSVPAFNAWGTRRLRRVRAGVPGGVRRPMRAREARSVEAVPPRDRALNPQSVAEVLTLQRQLSPISTERGVYAASSWVHQGAFGFLFAILTLGALQIPKCRCSVKP